MIFGKYIMLFIKENIGNFLDTRRSLIKKKLLIGTLILEEKVTCPQ